MEEKNQERIIQLEKDYKNYCFHKGFNNEFNTNQENRPVLKLEDYEWLVDNNAFTKFEHFLPSIYRTNNNRFKRNCFEIFKRYFKGLNQNVPPYRKNIFDIISSNKIIDNNKKFCNIETLDKYFKGFRSGLYILGAETGIGKTSLFLQIADDFALNKNYIIFCPLEMTAKELITKSIARIAKEQNIKSSFSSFEIFNNTLSNEDKTIFKSSLKHYIDNIEPYLYFAPIFNILELKDLINEYIEMYKVKPIIFVDYIQIMRADKQSAATIKEEVDRVTVELKRISKEYDLIIFAISSLNRSNYSENRYFYENGKKIEIEKNEFSTNCFKESGIIDYTGDVLIRMNNVNKSYFDTNSDLVQQVELLILKNRFGTKNEKIKLEFKPKYGLFK